MPDNSEFMYGLVGGLMIMAVLLLVFNTTWALPDGMFSGDGENENRLVVIIGGQAVYVPVEKDQRVIAAMPGPKEAGIVFDDTTQYTALGTFDVSSGRETQVFPAGTLKNGLMFGEEHMRFIAENPSKIRVFISKENSLGDFIMLVDSEVFAKQRLARGLHEFELNREGLVNIELRAESSDWQIWAPALYEIERVEIDTIMPAESFSFEIDVPRFYRGSLEFDFTQYPGLMAPSGAMASDSGTIEVMLNGETFYRGATGSRLVVPFTAAFSQNSVVVKAVDGSFSGAASLLTIHRDVLAKKAEFEYEISSRDKLPGWLLFHSVVVQPGTIVVRNIDSFGDVHLLTAETTDNGVRMLQLRSDYAKKGINKIVIEGAGDSLFQIRDITVVA